MSRLTRRLVQHHLPIGLATLAAGAVFYAAFKTSDIIEHLSLASAYPALILISLSLLIGPFKLMSSKRVPVSIDLRRDLGIWAGITGVFHACVGQFVHLRGRPWEYYIYPDWRDGHLIPLRYDPFGIANDAGLAAAFVLLLLLCLSNDASLRQLGTAKWKRLQRWNYACFALVAIHSLLYQLGIEGQKLPLVAIAVVAIGMTSVIQWNGYRMRKASA